MLCQLELVCLFTAWLILPPIGVQGIVAQQHFTGTCDTRIHIVDPGILRIENNYREFQIVLPTDMDTAWITYKLGDEYAYIGNCHANAHPFDDDFCQKVMTKIQSVGFY
jgi:hypothetical protein